MATDAMNQLTADAKLTARLAAATTPQELSDILHASLEDAHIAERDPSTGRFVRTTPEAAAVVPAAAAAAAAPKEFRKTQTIAGTSLEFVASSEAELTRQILDANRIAETFAEANRHERTSRTVQQEAMDRADADLALRRGEISTAEYLTRTHALEDALAARGVDLNTISSQQLTQSWVSASAAFREHNPDWPGGNRNQELIGLEIAGMGLIDADDKVAALTQAYETLKSKGMLFDGDHDAAELEKLALDSNASPQEIIEHWRRAQDVPGGDATKANEEFLRTFANGRRSSGLFNA